ncbi:SDR family NAD(P)-dependent oxidoreductase [Nocardia sp. NPDC059177]|uniref:SDR family NAD(P)-dependent oxidoreductase n=1 Tax=Nocardia sp. NPDC059177 TaxID=3346759 RepID=UPI0036BB32FC
MSGRGVVVVGGSSGIGYAVAELMARHGAGVVVNGRDGAAVDRAVREIGASGASVIGIDGSAGDETVAGKLIATCVEEFGAVDALVNCAGMAEPPGSSILEIDEPDWHAQLDSHLSTTFTTCRIAAPVMVGQGRGSIVNTSSFAFLGDYGGTGYAAAKGAVNSLTWAIAAELQEHSIRANVVCPGARTRLSTGSEYEEHIAELFRRGMIDEFTMQASLDPPPAEYAAALYLYLAGPSSARVTGEIFVAAGGFVGRYARPELGVAGFRDHRNSPPWTVGELHTMISPDGEV